jgi:hypothetical protein
MHFRLRALPQLSCQAPQSPVAWPARVAIHLSASEELFANAAPPERLARPSKETFDGFPSFVSTRIGFKPQQRLTTPAREPLRQQPSGVFWSAFRVLSGQFVRVSAFIRRFSPLLRGLIVNSMICYVNRPIDARSVSCFGNVPTPVLQMRSGMAEKLKYQLAGAMCSQPTPTPPLGR